MLTQYEMQLIMDSLSGIADTAEQLGKMAGLRDEQLTFKLGFVLGMLEGRTPEQSGTIIPTILTQLGGRNEDKR